MRPLADYFVDAFNKPRRAPVMSVIALVDNHWWAYECHLPGCCEGEPLPGLDDPNSVTAQLIRLDRTPGRRASEITQEFLPAEPEDAGDLLRALDNEGAAWAQHCATSSDDGTVLQATHMLLETAIRDFRNGATELAHDITARLIYGLNDEWAQDHGLEHIEDDDLPTPAACGPSSPAAPSLRTRPQPSPHSTSSPPSPGGKATSPPHASLSSAS